MGFNHVVIAHDHENHLKHKDRHYVYNVDAHLLISDREAFPIVLDKCQKCDRVVILLDIKYRVLLQRFSFFHALLDRKTLIQFIGLTLFLLDSLEIL